MRILLTLATLALFVSTSVHAAPSPAQKCAAAKMLAAGKATLAVIKCRKTALLKSAPIDPECIAKAEDKLAEAFAKAEAKGGCANVVDLPLIETYLDTCVDLYSELEALACGDGAGDGGEDVPCSCGSLVVTDTTLDAGFDSVVETTCGLGGLEVAAGVALDLGGHTISGGDGVGITPDDGASVANGHIEGFAMGVVVPDGAVSLASLNIDGNGQGLVVGQSDCTTSPVVGLEGSSSTVSDNDGTGVVVHPCASLTLTGVGSLSAATYMQILNNGGIGIDVRGTLTATWVTVGRSASHGIQVETDDAVSLTDVNVHNSGNHPTLPASGGIGIYVLRTGVPATVIEDGFLIQSTESQGRSYVQYNASHGIVLGDLTAQSGPVYGSVRDVQIFENELGIRVEQKDAITAPTHFNIASNNIYNNDDSGISIKTSYQRALPGDERRTISSNDVHHNAVTSDGCVPPGDVQTASQIVFDGKVMGSDPGFPPGPGYPDDYTCYQVGGTPLTETQCDRMNDPEDVLSGGVSNHCIWTGSECRLAWDMSGTVGTGECGTSDNRIFAYINEVTASEFTQKGVVATNGAFVLARRNTWGVGGADNGTYTVPGSNSEIDFEEACSTISTCTGASPASP